MAHDPLAMVDYGSGAGALLLCDNLAAGARAREAIEAAGLRVAAEHGIDGALERMDRQAAVDLVMVEIEEDHGKVLDVLLGRIAHDAREGRYGGVVSTPSHLVDVVNAAIGSTDKVFQLCDPSPADRLEAVTEAARRTVPHLHDVGWGSERLQRLSEEVGRIANALAELSEDESLIRQRAEKPSGPAIDATRVRAIIRARRLRDHYFRSELFADPAWDMLLDLMAARLDGKRVAVSSLCIAAAVPATTALRWIKTLTEHGLFVRVADPQDGRRVYIELSDAAATAVENYLLAAQRLSPLSV